MRKRSVLLVALFATAFAMILGSSLWAVTFTGTELLGRPTDTSVTVNVVADSALEAYFEYGTAPGSYTSQTPSATYSAGTPIVVTLTGMSADTRYYYRMRYRTPGAGTYEARPEHAFHTARPPGSSFVFTVQSDSHIYDKKGDDALYTIAAQNQLEDAPDFVLDLGDTFGNDHEPTTITAAEMDKLHLDQRPFMGISGCSAPVFIVLGNHEGEAGFYLSVNPPENIAVYGTKARLKYYPNPVPNGFYTGNEATEGYGIGQPQNYYAWQWGDALFVVLDAYRYIATDPKGSGTLWDWTLGRAQYDWFKATLEGSRARYKFVFAHHVLGQSRGAILDAAGYEWGGLGKDGSYEFDARRPGWGKPIHQLMADNGVTIFFQGHDHLYAREELDGVVYQEIPMPSDATYHVGDVNADDYTGVVVNDSGHVRVSVSPSQVKVDYVRAFLPGDGTNGEVSHSYTVDNPAPWAAFAFSPLSPKAGEPVTFTDQSGNGPTSWSWDFGDGATSAQQSPTHTFAAAGSYTVTLTVSNAKGSGTAARTLTVTSSCAISSVVKAANPFRLVLSGSGFQPGCTVTLDGAPAPTTTYVSATGVKAKGGASLKAMVPVGVPVPIVVVNPDGSRSAPFTYTR